MAKKKKTSGPGKPNLGAFKSQNDLLKSAEAQMGELAKSENEILAIQKQILDNRIKSEAVLAREVSAMETLADKASIREKLANAQVGVEKQIFDISKDLQNKVSKIAEFKGSEVDSSRALVKSAKKELAEKTKLGIISADASKYLQDELNERDKNIDAMIDMQGHAEKYGGIITGAMDSAKAATDEFFGSFPGGDAVKNMLGVDKAFETLKEGASAAMGAVVQSLLAGQGPMAALKAGQAAFNAVAMMNPYVAIAAALMLVIGLLFQQTKAMKEQAKAQGVTLSQAKQQIVASKQAAGAKGIELATSKDILSTQNAINNTLGTSLGISAENAAQVAEVGKAFGIGAEAAAETAGALLLVGAEQGNVAKLMEETNLKAAQAGVDMGKVQKDIATNAKAASKYLSGNPEALADAAIEAQKLGIDLATMAGMADKLLDIESSLQSQFEANAMLGRNMNFDKARQLALDGDIAGASKAVLEQVGSIADFENMNVKQKEKLAAAAGMEVGELEKSMRIQALRGKMTDEELAAAQGLNLSAAQLKDMSSEELAEKVKSAQQTEKTAAAFSMVKDQLMLAMQPLIDMVSMLFEVLNPVFKILGVVMKLGGVITSVVLSPLKMIGGILNAFMGALQPIFDIFDEIGEAIGGDGGMGPMFEKIGDILGAVIFAPLKMIANIIKAVLVPIIQFIGSIFSGIGDIISSIGQSIQDYLIAPMEKAMDSLSMLNPSNWFGGDDEAEVSVTATEDGEALEAAGAVNDGVIQNGKIISTNPADTILATKDPGSLAGAVTPPGAPPPVTPSDSGGFASKLGDMASSAMEMSPIGMIGDAIGGLFGGGEEGGSGGTSSDQVLSDLAAVLKGFQENGLVATVTDEAIRTMGNKQNANNSMR